MIDNREKRKRQLVFELQTSCGYEKRSRGQLVCHQLVGIFLKSLFFSTLNLRKTILNGFI